MHTVLFATANPGKKRLFVPIFARYGLSCITPAEAGLNSNHPPETGHTPEENALLKARAFHSPQWPLVFGDDAGLEIDALNGEPGLQTRRWGGHFADDVDDETWLHYLLARLQGVPPEKRTARFVAAWALIDPAGDEHVHRLVSEFCIAVYPRRPITPGFPLSAVQIGLAETIEARSEQLAREWERWGVLDVLRQLYINTRRD
jgi:XTP/dITP diphosphohydrolase